jgi:hypothetical protein
MNYIIILFSSATILAGIIILIKPEIVFDLIRRNLASFGLHVLAVVIRIIIGIALIVCATKSKYPTTILIIGWISIAAASTLGIMGRVNFKRLMSWALSVAPSFGRIGGLLAILFGSFLIHAVV